MSEVRQLLGDLAVATVELAASPPPALATNRIDYFAAWYAHTERWLRLAIDAGIAIRAVPADLSEDLTPDLLQTLAESLRESRLLRGLLDAVDERFGYLGYEEGWLYGAIAWEELCVVRSGLEVLRDLLEGEPELAAELELSHLENRMAHWGHDLFEPLEVPAGMPRHHWWWFRGSPPGVQRMNRRMADLLALGASAVPPKWSAFVQRGFAVVGDCVVFRDLAPPVIDDDPTTAECRINAAHVEDYLERDPSRRPVDLAGAALACAQHLAGELRRRVAAPCRVIVNLQPRNRTSTIRFHRIRPGRDWLAGDLEGYVEEGVLVLDTDDSTL